MVIANLKSKVEAAHFVFRIPVSHFCEHFASTTISICGYGFFLSFFPNTKDIGWHSLYIILEEDIDMVPTCAVTADIELVSHSACPAAKKANFRQLYLEADAMGYENFVKTKDLQDYVKHGHVTIKAKISAKLQ